MVKDFIKYLETNNYSKNTIKTYIWVLETYKDSLSDQNMLKQIVLKHQTKPSTAWTFYYIFIAYLKWCKLDYSSLKELNMPTIPYKYFDVFTKEYLIEKTTINENDSLLTKKKKLIIRFLFETGIRVFELETISLNDSGTLTILGKGNKQREIFHNIETTKQILDIKVHSKTIRLWVKEILGKQFSPHSIRRSFATYMLKSGANPKMVMLQLGHSKIETTYRYLQLSLVENKQIYDQYMNF